jgi:hypothetical protein
MISQRLVLLIEKHADEIARRWLKDVQENPKTPGYHAFPEKTLYKRAFEVYSNLGRFVGSEEHRDEVKRIYLELGAERFHEGFLVSEVVEALSLTKRHLWWYIREHGLLDTAVQLYQGLELHNSVVLFFDRAVYYAIVGYEQAAGLAGRKAG